MKKLFTFAAAVLFTASMFAADEVLFSWTPKTGLSNADISAGTYTLPGDWLTSVTGGIAEMVVPSNGNMRIRGSQLAFNSSNSYFHITLNEALQAGDQILINSSGNTNNLWFSVESARPSSAENAAAVIEQGKAYTIGIGNALIDKIEFYVWRAGSTTQLGEFSIVRPEPSTDPVINATDASIIAKESGVEATQDIEVVGANLTGSILTATLSPAVEGLSVTLAENAITDGAISTTATLHYTQTENVPEGQTTLTLSDGTTSKEVTITYKANVVLATLQSISGSTSWDFSKIARNTASTLHNNNGIRLTNESTPSYNDEIVYINYADGDLWTLADGFDGTTMAFKGEYPTRNNQYCQNGVLRFNTTVPGKIVVKFSDTGTSKSTSAVKRYLVVNDVQTEYWTSRENNGNEPYAAQLDVTSGEIAVEAGDVTITGSSAIVVSQVTFTQTYAVSCATPEHGSLSADKALAAAGEKVTLTVTPADGYQIAAVKLDDESLVEEEGVYSFIMPAKAVSVTATFSKATAIDNAEVNEKAVKTIENGQLVIIKNGVRYNAQGAVVK